MKQSWFVMDKGSEGSRCGPKKYIDRGFESEEIAEFEIRDLLKYFPVDSEWYDRLYAEELTGERAKPENRKGNTFNRKESSINLVQKSA